MKKPIKPLALIGYRTVGKSTIARWVARLSGWDLLHMDERIVELAGKSIADWVAESGWAPFRKLESEVLDQALASSNPIVIDTGGGVIEDPANREALRERSVAIWLDCDTELIIHRLTRDTVRPSLTGKSHAEELTEVLERRKPLYRETARSIVNTTHRTPEATAHRVLELYDQSMGDA